MWTRFFLPGLLCSLAAAAPRQSFNLNRDWTFQYQPAETLETGWAAPSHDDSRWPAVALPHTWSTFETTGEPHPYIHSANERADACWWYGWGWYRKRFSLDAGARGRKVFLEFDGVQKYSRVYLNGDFVGDHKGGFTSFSFDVTAKARFGEPNVLAVAVSNRRDDQSGRIPPMTAGNWNPYGGICRDVRLVLKDPLHIPYQGSAWHEGGTFVTTPEVSAARRRPARRQANYRQPWNRGLPHEIAEIEEHYKLPASSRAEARQSAEAGSPAFQALLDRLADVLVTNSGELAADDYIFAVRNYNWSRAAGRP